MASKTTRKVPTYIKNVGKSFGYAVGDVLADYNPTISALAKTTKNTVSSVKSSMTQMKTSNISSATKDFMKSDESALTNLIDDLKSGKWYNKDREDSMFNDFDFNFDEDWGDFEDEEDNTGAANKILEQNEAKTKALVGSVSKASSDISKSVGYASAQSAQYIVAANTAASRAIYDMTSKGFNQVTEVLLNVNAGIETLNQLGVPVATHIQNSSVFYTQTTQTLNNINDNLEKLVQRTSFMDNGVGGKRRTNKKGSNRFIFGDTFSPDAYVEFVKEGIKEVKDEFSALLGMGKTVAGKNGKNLSPMQEVLVGAIDAMMPKFFKESMKEFNKSLNNTIIRGLRLGSKKASASTNPIINLLGSIFLPNDRLRADYDTANYNKGQVAWDGIARKSLVEVIPTYLAKIYAALGGEEKYYDYEAGRFVTMKQISDRRDLDQRVAAQNAGGKFRETALKRSQGNATIEKQIDQFFIQAFISGEDITEIRRNLRNSSYLKAHGLSKEAASIIVGIMNDADKGKNGVSRNIYTNYDRNRFKGVLDYNSRVKQEELSGHSTNSYLHNGFAAEMDSHNKNQLYYLRGIYNMIGNMYGSMVSNPNANLSNFDVDTGKFRTSSSTGAAKENSNMDVRTGYREDEMDDRDLIATYGMTHDEIDKYLRKKEMKKNTKKIMDEAEKQVDSIGKKNKPFQKFKDVYDTPFHAISNVIGTLSTGINQLFWGDDGESGLIAKMFDKTTNFWDEMKERAKNKLKEFWDWTGIGPAVSEEWGNIKNGFMSRAGKFFKGNKARTQDISGQLPNNVAGLLPGPVEGNARGKRVTKTGLIAVSEGELIIPSELNPFYKGKTNKRQQIRKENNLINRFYGSFAKGGTVGGDEDSNGFLGTISDGAKILASGLSSFIKQSMFGNDPEKERKKVYSSLGEAMEDMNNNKGAMVIGGMAGAGVSLLTGAIVGPLAGAAIGAGAGLLLKSEKIQKALFGEPDENGNYDSKIANFIKKELPDTAVGTGLGAAAGSFFGSPLVGAIIGTGLGYVAASDKAKNFLFGTIGEDGKRSDDGVVPPEVTEKLKKAAPNMTAGALAGMVAGPFGLAGNIIMGSAVGYLSTSDKFHEYMFGEDGLANKIHDKIFDHLDNLFRNTGNRVAGMIKKGGVNIFDFITKRIKKLSDDFESGKGGLFTKLIGGTINLGGKAVKGAVSAVGAPIRGLSTHMQKKNLAGGYSVYGTKADGSKGTLTAKERNNMRQNLGVFGNKYSDFDSALANITSQEDLEELQMQLQNAQKGNIDQDYFANKGIDISKYSKGGIATLRDLAKSEDKNRDWGSAQVAEEQKYHLNVLEYLKSIFHVGKKVAGAMGADTSDINPNVDGESKVSDVIKNASENMANNRQLLLGQSDEDENQITTQVDMFGNVHQYTTNNQGEITEVTNDNETKKSKNIINKFTSAVESLPGIGAAIGGIKGLLGGFGEKLFGDKEGKKKGLLSSILEMLNGENGPLSWLTSILSGTTVGKVTKNLLSKITLKGIITDIVGPGLLLAGLGGAFDSAATTMTDGAYGSDKVGSKDDVRETADGIEVHKDANGNWVDSEGNIYNEADLRVRKGGNDALSAYLWKGTARGVVTGKPTLAGKALGRTSYGKKIGSGLTKFAEAGTANGKRILEDAGARMMSTGTSVGAYLGDDAAKAGASFLENFAGSTNAYRQFESTKNTAKSTLKGILKSDADDAMKAAANMSYSVNMGKAATNLDDAVAAALKTNVDDALAKIIKNIGKLPFVGEKLAASGTMGKMGAELSETITKALGKSSKALAKASASFAKIAPVVTIAFMIGDFTTGWEDARTTLGIVDDPTTGQRALSGLLRLVKNLIPIVGPLVPDNLVVQVLAKYIGPALGIDTSELLAKQQKAKETLDAYNAATGENIASVGDFNKKVLKDYTWTERIGNAAKTTSSQAKAKFKNAKEGIKEQGFGGYIKSVGSDMLSQFMDTYNEEGGGLAGSLKGMGDVFANLLPGVFGEIAKANADINAYAVKGELKNLWSVELSDFSGGNESIEGTDLKTAVPSVFSRIIGQIPLIVNKISFTPVALLCKLFGKIGSSLKDSGIVDSVKNGFDKFTDNGANMIDYIVRGDVSGLLANKIDDDEGNPLGGVYKVLNFGQQVISFIPTAVSWVGHKLSDGVKGIVNKAKSSINTIEESYKYGEEALKNGASLSEFMDFSDFKDDEGNPIGGITKSLAVASRITTIPVAITKKIGSEISKAFGKAADKVKASVSGIKKDSDTMNGFMKAGDIKSLWTNNYKDNDEDNPIAGIMGGINFGQKVVYSIPTVTVAAGKAIAAGANKVIGVIKSSVNAIQSDALTMEQYMKDGDITGLWSADLTQNDENNPLGGFMKGINFGQKVVFSIPTAISWAGKKIKSGFDTVVSKITTAVEDVDTQHDNLSQLAKAGDVKGIMDSAPIDDEENPLNGIMGGINFAQKISVMPSALFHLAGSKLKESWESFTDKLNTDHESLSTAVDALKEAAKTGDLSKVKDISFKPSEDNPLGGIFTAAFKLSQGFQSLSAMLHKVTAPIKEVVDGVSDTVKKAGEKLSDLKDEAWDKAKEAVNSAWNGLTDWLNGSGSGIGRYPAGGNSGFISQYDPRYRNNEFAGSTFGEKGCGPAVAAMAANAMGKNMSLNEAINASRGYQTSGGTTLDYFKSALGAKGISTQLISGGSSAQIYNKIANGQKVILLGRDRNNDSKDKSPFGPNNHYILATGIDGAGNIIVNDPESNRPRSYDPSILNSTSFGVAGGGSLYNISGDEKIAKQVWYYLRNNLGFTEKAAAGVLGNLEQETHLNPSMKNSVTQGIACWDKQNGTFPLEAAANKAGKDWKDLGFQLSYLDQTLPDAFKNYTGKKPHYYSTGEWCWWPKKMTWDEFKKLDNVSDAAEIFERVYERASKPLISQRKHYANQWYKKLSGKDGDPIESSTSSGNTFTSALQAASNIGSIFSNAFGKIFGTSSGDSSSSGTTSEDGMSVNAVNLSGKSDPVDYMKSKLGKLSYSMKGPRDPEKGSADCSSTVKWAIKKATGGKVDLGGYTGAQQTSKDAYDIANNHGKDMQSLPSNIKRNDIMFFVRDYAKNNPSLYPDGIGHVGLYIGDGKYIDHGSGMGPKIKTFSPSSHLSLVRRLKDYTWDSGSGSGLDSRNVLLNSNISSRSNNNIGQFRNTRSGNISGGASNITESTKNMLATIRTNAKNASSNGAVSAELVNKLLESITGILNTIAENTAPVDKIYKVLVSYLSASGSGSGNKAPTVVKERTKSQSPSSSGYDDMDSNISTLVGVLAELAKG